MTMAKVENGTVTQVGIPDELRSLGVRQLKNKGWHKVVDSAGKPTTKTDPGYHWVYGAEWSVEDGHVIGVWQVAKRPQPYPSWSFVEGEGWVAPVAKPDDGNDYYWDESEQKWAEITLD